MNDARPAIAVMRRRLDRRYAVDWSVRFLLLGAIAALFAPLFSARLSQVVLTLLLPLGASSEAAQAEALRHTPLFSLPLYGRQLARSLAVAPALIALAAPLGFLCGLAARHRAAPPEWWVIVLAANAVAGLIALGAVFRDGALAWLYRALAVAAAAAIAAPYAGHVVHALALSLLLALLFGFAALRAFGETLARYDPLPT